MPPTSPSCILSGKKWFLIETTKNLNFKQLCILFRSIFFVKFNFIYHFSVKQGAAKPKWVVQQKCNDTKMLLKHTKMHQDMAKHTIFFSFKMFLLYLHFW